MSGATPVVCEVEEKTLSLNLKNLKKFINKKTKAVIPVHLYGHCCNLSELKKICKQKKIAIIEDAAQSIGAKYKGKYTGTYGDIGGYSLNVHKHINTGEGGMISTNNKKIWMKCWSIKDHGKNYKSVFFKKHKQGFRWLHDEIGSNYRMTEIQSALGRIQLKRLDQQIKKRNKIVSLYYDKLKIFWEEQDLLKKPDFISKTCPLNHKNCKSCIHSFYRLNFYINIKKINQLKLIDQLNAKNISSGVGSCPEIYREKIFQKLKMYPSRRLKVAKLLGKSSLMFPINPYKPLIKINSEILSIKKILNNYL